MLYILSCGLRVSRLQLLTFNAAVEINANYLGYFRSAATSNTADRSIPLLQSRVVFTKKKKKKSLWLFQEALGQKADHRGPHGAQWGRLPPFETVGSSDSTPSPATRVEGKPPRLDTILLKQQKTKSHLLLRCKTFELNSVGHCFASKKKNWQFHAFCNHLSRPLEAI